MRDTVAQTAGMIREAGVAQGDRVIIYMPMIPEAVFAMLACARIGAIHSVVFGGFAAPELAKRIDDAKPTLILTASCGIEGGRIVAYKPLVDAACDLSTYKVPRVILLQRPQQEADMQAGRDGDWAELLASATPADPVPVKATDPLYILYTSGTTGVPKGVVRDNGGHAVALAWSMANIYGAAPGETFWAASDIGWVVGHSYIVYAPLIAGCTTILYEGKPVGTPDAGAFWRVIRDHGVDIFFTAPTAIRAIRREDGDASLLHADGKGKLRTLFLAGERADPDTVHWAEQHLGVPVIDHWWQTELGWPAIATCVGLGRTETYAGSAGHPVPGYRFAILDTEGVEQPHGEIGELTIALPLPPGCLPTLWQRDEHFHASYLERHPGYYTAGDAGLIDDDGRIHVMSRIDDLINVAGHRLSTGGMEQVVVTHPAVAECAVIGLPDDLKGEVPLGFVTLKAGAAVTQAELEPQLVALVRDQIGPVAAFKHAVIVEKLPKTRSGKILRATLRLMAAGQSVAMPPTIDDPDAIRAVRDALAEIHAGA
jgi:propionyl-CoA synthetase